MSTKPLIHRPVRRIICSRSVLLFQPAGLLAFLDSTDEVPADDIDRLHIRDNVKLAQACVSLVYLMCISCISCVSHVYLMCVSCVSHVCLMCVSCVSHVYLMCISCVSHVYLMCVSCVSHVYLMCISCVSHVYLMFPEKTQWLITLKLPLQLDISLVSYHTKIKPI